MASRLLLCSSFYLIVIASFFPLLVLSENESTAADSSTSAESISTFTEDEKCYSVPYGITGFVSHVLTFYSAWIILIHRKRPLMPWKDIEGIPQSNKRILWDPLPTDEGYGAYEGSESPGKRKWNIALAVIKALLAAIPTIVNMTQCRYVWQFRAIAAMKLLLSLASSLNETIPSSFWAFIYLPGVVAGLIGSGSMAKVRFDTPNSGSDRISDPHGAAVAVTVVFVIVAVISFGLMSFCMGRRDAFHITSCGFTIVLVFGALYSDWILAIVVQNLAGYPKDGSKSAQVLWVLYFIGKRLNLLML